jgi:hypothetical protein
MRAGIRIDNDTSGNTHQCTMGFHVRYAGDEQFLTAGHCGHNRPADWWHVGYGFVGNAQATMYEPGGRDAMRIDLPDGEVSNLIYATASVVGSYRSPMLNEPICSSLGHTNAVDCGTVSATSVSWSSPTCGCTVWGSSYTGIASEGGDSGSPMYSVVTGPDVALGLLANSTKFARASDAIPGLNVSLVTSTPAPPGDWLHDYTSDGRADLIAIDDTTGYLWTYPGNGAGGWGSRIGPDQGWASMNAIAGGANYAGTLFPDLIAIDDTTGYLWTYPGTGTGWLGNP